MSLQQDEPILRELVNRLAEVEQANARLHEELGALRAERSTAPEQLVPRPLDVLGVFSSSVAGIPAVRATGTGGADGVDATSDSGFGVFASSQSSAGVVAQSQSSDGVVAQSQSGAGVVAQSVSGRGVFASKCFQ
jgi:hypothetical protein